MADDVPDLSVKHLRAVVALARFGSFIAAASYLGISQPGLSRIVQQAEALLGAALFARGTRSVSQTAAGREFIPAAERLLGELSQQAKKVRALDGELRGQLIIACLMSISHHLLPTALVAFRKQHPKMYIHIREGLASGVLEDVRSGLADFGIGNATGVPPALAVESVAAETCYVVLPLKHPLAAGSSLRLKELAEEPMISMPTDSGLRRTIDLVASAQGVALNHSIIINQFASLFDFVTSGLGVAIVPASALPPAAGHAIAVRPLKPAISRRIGILHLAERPLSPASEAFLAIFRPRFFAAIRGRCAR
ncbi:MAG: LysR family transcriptional regulator [Alphaproteobacteria bacterium]